MLRLWVYRFWVIACRLIATLWLTVSSTNAQNVPGKDIEGCSRDAIEKLVSPDRAWVAFVQEEICSDGAFQTTLVDYVQVARRHAWPTRQNDVFAVEEHGASENRPILQWVSSRKLQITIPNKSLIDLQNSNYQGIDVVVRFDHDDPIERQQFLKGLGLDPK